MFLYVCKQTFGKLYRCMTREFLELKMRNFQGIIFIWTRTHWEIFESALLHLKKFRKIHRKTHVPETLLLKKRLWHRCFPVNFAKFLRTPFSIEPLRWLLLNLCKHFYGKIWKKLHISKSSNIFKFLLSIYRLNMFALGWKRNEVIRFHRNIKF